MKVLLRDGEFHYKGKKDKIKLLGLTKDGKEYFLTEPASMVRLNNNSKLPMLTEHLENGITHTINTFDQKLLLDLDGIKRPLFLTVTIDKTNKVAVTYLEANFDNLILEISE